MNRPIETRRTPALERVLPDAGLGALVAIAVVGLDQVSKSASTFAQGADARNHGLLLGVGAGPRVALIAASGAVIAIFVVAILRAVIQIGGSVLGPTLVLAGMIGNLADRVRFGSVRDFLVAGPFIINVADIAVALGIVLTVGTVAVRAYAFHRGGTVVAFDRRHLRLVVEGRATSARP
jgi:lipoprotein signal peptidase